MRVLDMAVPKPDDLLDAEPGLQLRLDRLARKPRIAILVEQALLRRDQRPLSVDRQRAAFQHHLGDDPLDPECVEDRLAARRILVEG